LKHNYPDRLLQVQASPRH